MTVIAARKRHLPAERTLTTDDEISALRTELSSRYRLKDVTYTIGGQGCELTVVDNTSEVLDRLAAAGPDDPDVRDERLPYWATLWRSSLVLSEVLLSELSAGARLVELGSGLGLCAAIAIRSGAHVTATDYQPDALRFTKLNALRIAGRAPRTALMDWRAPDTSLVTDLIIGADLAYETRFYAPLIDTFDALLNPGGRILFAEANRDIAKPFFPLLEKRGWTCVPRLQTPGATVYTITRRG